MIFIAAQYYMFQYSGQKGANKVSGLAKASNLEELRDRLLKKGIRLIKAKSLWGMSGSVSIDEIIRFSGQMHSMTNSGISSDTAIKLIAEYASEDFKYILADIRNNLNQGFSLADSFRKNGFFSTLFCETIAMGEKSSKLPEAFYNIRKFYMSEKDIKRKAKSMLMYPCVVLSVLLIVTILMSTFILPQFGDIYEGMGAELPMITKVYIRFGEYITSSWWMFILSICGLVFGFKKYRQPLLHRKNLDRFVLDIPLVGFVQKQILVARFSNILSLYLKSGVRIQDSILSSARILQNQSVYDEFVRGTKLILKGENFYQIVDEISIFPPFFKQVVFIGEQSSGLSESLIELSDTLDADVKETLEVLSKNMNQFIVIGLFVLLAPTIIAILLPVLNLTKVASEAGGL